MSSSVASLPMKGGTPFLIGKDWIQKHFSIIYKSTLKGLEELHTFYICQEFDANFILLAIISLAWLEEEGTWLSGKVSSTHNFKIKCIKVSYELATS